MKKKFLTWLYNYLQPKYSDKQKSKINRFKSYFRTYFEGCYDNCEANDPISISRFGITDFLFEFKNEKLIVTIVLERPGILIGKAGRTIDGLNKYLSSDNIEVHIKESKLWSYLR